MAARPAILLIGTGHWSNPGLDYHQDVYDDMRAPARQREIAECVERLSAFYPSKVALEITQDMEADWNADYRAFRRGAFDLTANERHQLGFRLAAAARLDRIDAIDWHNTERAIGWDEAIAYAQQNGQLELISSWFEHHDESDAIPLTKRSVRDQLLAHDEPNGLARGQANYLRMALIGSGPSYIGAEVILRWYERNMHMVVNIARLADSLDERIAVVVGSGHLPLLLHFLEGTQKFEIARSSEYL